MRAEGSLPGGLGVRRKDRQLARGALGAGFRRMDGDIYMEWGLVKCGCGLFVCAVVWWVVRGVV